MRYFAVLGCFLLLLLFGICRAHCTRVSRDRESVLLVKSTQSSRELKLLGKELKTEKTLMQDTYVLSTHV